MPTHTILFRNGKKLQKSSAKAQDPTTLYQLIANAQTPSGKYEKTARLETAIALQDEEGAYHFVDKNRTPNPERVNGYNPYWSKFLSPWTDITFYRSPGFAHILQEPLRVECSYQNIWHECLNLDGCDQLRKTGNCGHELPGEMMREIRDTYFYGPYENPIDTCPKLHQVKSGDNLIGQCLARLLGEEKDTAYIIRLTADFAENLRNHTYKPKTAEIYEVGHG